MKNFMPLYMRLHYALEPENIENTRKSISNNNRDEVDEEQFEDGYCKYCGAEEDKCPGYKCWI